MNAKALVLLFLMGVLTSCQSQTVPVERTNDCVCDWFMMRKIVDGSTA